MLDILIEKAKNPKDKPAEEDLGFGQFFTDHMFVMDYSSRYGWHNPKIVPYDKLSFEPSIMVFHYGQAVFEGLKAYRTDDDRILLFRPEKNMERLNASCSRLCIPEIDIEFAVEAIKTLVNIDREWVPKKEGTSLYIRPFIIATDPYLGVRPSDTYKFIIILSPVGTYYPEGINPVKIYVETKYIRAVKGGMGYAKTPGNYAGSLIAQVEAKKKGYTQVLWLDCVERKYIEEVGTMNVFFKINNEVITPPLEGTILPGITRQSVIELLKNWGINVQERKISIEEIYVSSKKGILEESFGTGTAAVISPIGELNWNDTRIEINNGNSGILSKKLYDTLTGIQYGRIKDDFGWTTEVK